MINSELRLRVFAGPNESGKSTVIQSVREAQVNERLLDFGIYVNADDIASALGSNEFSFEKYDVDPTKEDILDFSDSSGLLEPAFDLASLNASFEIRQGRVILKQTDHKDRLAQIIARFLREVLLASNRRFSFETVFSHPSNLDIMKRAAESG